MEKDTKPRIREVLKEKRKVGMYCPTFRWDNKLFAHENEIVDYIYEKENEGEAARLDLSFEWGTGSLLLQQYINHELIETISLRKEEYLKLLKFVEKHGLDSLTSVNDI